MQSGTATRQTRWRIARDLPLPPGIELVFLPAYSPELKPAERLWPLVDEPVANRAFPTLDAPEAVLVERCRALEADPARLRGHTRFHMVTRRTATGDRTVLTRNP